MNAIDIKLATLQILTSVVMLSGGWNQNILFNHLFARAYSVHAHLSLAVIYYAIVLSYSRQYSCRSSWSTLTW